MDLAVQFQLPNEKMRTDNSFENCETKSGAATPWAAGNIFSCTGSRSKISGVVLFAIAIRGGGPYSADNAIGKEL